LRGSHLVGDIHQPLRKLFTADYPKDNRGGNEIWVRMSQAGQPVSDSSMHDPFFMPLVRNFPPVAVCPIPTPIFTNVLITAQPRQGSFKLTILPLAERNCSAIGMASCLLNFLVWFGSANIAARHSSIHHIGSKAKSPAWYFWTSSFVTVVTCKHGNSDCVPRKSVFGIDRPQ
jgi:hypothetical protein